MNAKNCMTTMLAIVAALCITAINADVFEAEFDLTSLLRINGGDGSAGFVIEGARLRDQAGFSIAPAGDFNGDGLDDIIIGAPASRVPGSFFAPPGSGGAYIIFGDATGFAAEFLLTQLMDTGGVVSSAGLFVAGATDRAGFSVSAAGDFDDDGWDDVVIGAPGDLPNFHGVLNERGCAHVIYGAPEGIGGRFAIETPNEDPFMDTFDRTGTSVGGGGDLNGDGIADLIVGAPGAHASYALLGGERYTGIFQAGQLFADNGGTGERGFVLRGHESGNMVAVGGDVNSDGIDDLLVGSNARRYAVFGAFQDIAPELPLTSLHADAGGDGSQGFQLDGAQDDHFISPAGDLNADGIDDVFVGKFTDLGVTHGAVVFGDEASFPAVYDLTQLLSVNGGDGTDGVVFIGEYNRQMRGQAAGDVNSDGIDDLIIRASSASYIIYGSESGFESEIELSQLRAGNGGDGTVGFALTGYYSVIGHGAAAGDLNGDGIADLMVSFPQTASQFETVHAKIFVVFGRSESLIPNQRPVFISEPVHTGDEGELFSYEFSVADPDAANSLTTITPTLPAWLSLTGSTASFRLSGIPAATDTGANIVAVKVTDNGVPAKSSWLRFSINIAPNHPPEFTGEPPKSATENVDYSATITASDPDIGHVLTFTSTNLPSWLTLENNGDGSALLSGTPSLSHVGANPIAITVADSVSVPKTASLSFLIEVAPNHPPEFTSEPPKSATENVDYSATITASDPDIGHVLTFTSTNLPSWLTLENNGDGSALLSGTPSFSHVGANPVSITVADSVSVPKTASLSFTIEVAAKAPANNGGQGGSGRVSIICFSTLIGVFLLRRRPHSVVTS